MNLKDFGRAGFGNPIPETQRTWDGWRDNAFSERAIMMAEFHAWVVKTRIETEGSIICFEQDVKELEPFARAGIDNAKAPSDVPLIVLDFAASSLALFAAKRRMATLDAYYKSNGNWGGGQERLQMNPGEEIILNELWDWFIEERVGKKGKDAS